MRKNDDIYPLMFYSIQSSLSITFHMAFSFTISSISISFAAFRFTWSLEIGIDPGH